MNPGEFRAFVDRLGQELKADLIDENGELGVNLHLDNGRHQKVFLGLGKDPLGRPMLAAYTIIGEVQDIELIAALELNATTPYGAVAVWGSQVIMRRTERLTSLAPDSLVESIQLLALNADLIEQTLYGRRDRF